MPVMTTTASRALTGARRRAGLVVRSRIAGDDAAERRQRIWHSEGERWNSPGDAICAVHGDASMFAAG
ncbi:MAG: DUF2236 domain-containing protein, partial [Dietzia cercidiphylli]